jgi:transcription elongation factor Elf1
MMSPVPANDKKSKLLVYTIEECPVCGQKTKRAFTVGDYVTKDGAACSKCSNTTRITLVYAESAKPSG